MNGEGVYKIFEGRGVGLNTPLKGRGGHRGGEGG